MLNSKTEALGIIFPNSYDAMVPDLVSERLMASIPFASRYRMCDFILSSMVHSGIDNISIIVRKNYHSLLDHLGAGREWDLVRKNGGLNIVPPFAQKQVKVFEGRIEALESLRGYLLKQPQKYVIMTDANIAINFDFNELLEIGKENIIILATKAKIAEFHHQPFLVDTPDEELNKELCGYYRVITAYGEFTMCRVSES